MNILLIDPPYEILQGVKGTLNYPLGLAYITSILNKNGHNAVYVNLDWDQKLPVPNYFNRNEISNRFNKYLDEVSKNSTHYIWDNFRYLLNDFRPDIIGITSTTIKIKSALKLLKIAKEFSNEIITVMGGHHSQVFYSELLNNCDELDFVILGEGENAILELINAIQEKGKKNVEHIENIVFRTENKSIIVNKQSDLIRNLDSIPFASQSCSYLDKSININPILALMASRGCPYNCSYCATNNIWKRKIRRRSTENVILELKHILSTQKKFNFAFYDDCFTLDKTWFIEFCNKLIEERLRINWSCITSSKLLDEEVFKLAVKAGCNKINIGIESGSKRILSIANKKIDLNEIRNIFKMSKKYRISTAAYFMIGFPTETEEDIIMTQNYIKEIKPNWVYCNVLIPLPGTIFFDTCAKNNLIDSSEAWNGNTIKSPIMNFTNTMSDEKFYSLVDKTFDICFKINKNFINLIKRAPIQNYITQPISLFHDIKKVIAYINKC